MSSGAKLPASDAIGNFPKLALKQVSAGLHARFGIMAFSRFDQPSEAIGQIPIPAGLHEWTLHPRPRDHVLLEWAHGRTYIVVHQYVHMRPDLELLKGLAGAGTREPFFPKEVGTRA